MTQALWVVGDIHGAYTKLCALLERAGLIDQAGQWQGGQAHLAFLGDYLDRGPDGIGVIRLVQSLEKQAAEVGGQVTALVGNHEVMFLAANRFHRVDPTDRLGFYDYWAGNGGLQSDMQRLEPQDIRWLSTRPGIARIDKWLMIHADSLFYLQLGHSLESINERIAELLVSPEPAEWGNFANTFVDRLNFAGTDGEQQAQHLLNELGGQCIVHGHSPVHLLLAENDQQLQASTTAPVMYAAGRCLDMDSGMAYFTDAGFIARLGEDWVEEVITLPLETSHLVEG